MTELVTPISTAIATFTVTNIDDILILILFFAQVNVLFRTRQIVTGQYLGFILLVLASIPGFFGSFLLPNYLLRGLGLLPIFLGLTYLNKVEEPGTDSLDQILPEEDRPRWLNGWLSPQVYIVAAVTVANGGDNISVYLSLFASSTANNLMIILVTFLFLVGVWCWVAYRLNDFPVIASKLQHQGNTFAPCVLIGLGVYILKENLLSTLFALIISYLWVIKINQDHFSLKD